MILKSWLPPSGRILIGFIFALSMGFFLQYLYFAPYGFDLTDEGFYFNWYKYPDSFPAVITFFGFVYAPPYYLLGENIVALRVFNLLTIWRQVYGVFLSRS